MAAIKATVTKKVDEPIFRTIFVDFDIRLFRKVCECQLKIAHIYICKANRSRAEPKKHSLKQKNSRVVWTIPVNSNEVYTHHRFPDQTMMKSLWLFFFCKGFFMWLDRISKKNVVTNLCRAIKLILIFLGSCLRKQSTWEYVNNQCWPTLLSYSCLLAIDDKNI